MSNPQDDDRNLIENDSAHDEPDSIPHIIIQPDRRNVKGISGYEGVFLVVNATLGAGLLNFPQAYDQAGGLVVASALLVIILVFVIGALFILAHFADVRRSCTYQDVVLSICGPVWHGICAAIIILYLFGACVTFLIVIADQYERGLASLYGSDFCHYWYMSREFTLTATTVIFILPLCFSRRIDFLKYPSALGVVSVVYIVFLVIYQYYHVDHHDIVIKNGPKSWTDIFLVVPAICFGFQCHISSVPVYSCMQNRRPVAFGLVVTIAMLLCFTCYSLIAGFGYLTYGSVVPSDIMLMYEANNSIVIVGIVMLAIKTAAAFPVLTFCGRTAVDAMWVSWMRLPPSEAAIAEPSRRIVISTVWLTTTLLLAIVTPNIGVAIRALGSLAAIMIFMFPGWILFRHVCIKDPNLYLVKDRLLLVISIGYQAFGAFLFSVVLVQSVMESEPADKIRLCI